MATGASLGEIGAGRDCAATSPSAPTGRSSRSANVTTGRRRRSGTWPGARWSPRCTVRQQRRTATVALSPDGRMLAVGGFGRVVRLWDVRTGKLVHELDQGGDGAFTLEFSPDGRTLAVSGFEPVASLWDVATGAQIGPRLTAGRPQDDDRSVPRRTPAVGDPRQRPGGCLGRRPGVVGAARLRRSPTAR